MDFLIFFILLVFNNLLLTWFHTHEMRKALKNKVDAVYVGFWKEDNEQNIGYFFTEADVRADTRVKAWIKVSYCPGQNYHLQKLQVRHLPNGKIELATISS